MRVIVLSVILAALATQSVGAVEPTASIAGQAFIQTESGSPRTCAGQDDVLLLPETASGQIEALFSSASRGFVGVTSGAVRLPPEVQSAACDAGGHFKFSALVPGVYFVLSKITWANEQEGGYLMRRVTVAPGVTAEPILSTRLDDAPKPAQPKRDSRQVVAEKTIKARLLDPSSAEFQWSSRWLEDTEYKAWRWSKPVKGDVTCGRVNARNRMGGYVGQSTFLVVVSNGAVVHLQMDTTADTDLSIPRLMCQKGGFF